MGSTVIGAIPYPELTDPPNIPAHLRAMAEAIMQGIPPRFGSVAERTAAYATLGITPATGALCYLNSTARYETYNGTAWAPLLGAWTDWVPILSNLTLGSGTLTAVFLPLDDVVDWYFRFALGAGSAVGTNPMWTLPIAPHSRYPVSASFGTFPGGGAVLEDAGTAQRQANVTQPSSGTVGVNYWTAVPTVAQVTAIAPWTWGPGDSITAWGRYGI